MSFTAALIQTSISPGEKENNLIAFEKKIKTIASDADLIVLPEMFSTGFNSTNDVSLAETIDGNTMQTVAQWASNYQTAICGSFFCTEHNAYYNRLFFITPDGKNYWYDKRHLFLGQEKEVFAVGQQQHSIIEYKGLRFKPIICYDLRFPVWCRNKANEYDVLLCVANWPHARIEPWNTLLKARAVENLAYCIGVNIVGTDNLGINYSGSSQFVDFKGISENLGSTESIRLFSLEKKALNDFRQKFPVWEDADNFEILT